MRLHADGMLDLDAPIGHYLPDYRPHPRHGHPTTRQLLTHTAGLGNPLPIRWVRLEGQDEDPAVHQRILARHGTPKTPRRAAAGVLQHRLPPGRRSDRGRRPGTAVEDNVRHQGSWTHWRMTTTGYDYLPGSAHEPSATCAMPARRSTPACGRCCRAGSSGPAPTGLHRTATRSWSTGRPTAVSSATSPTRSRLAAAHRRADPQDPARLLAARRHRCHAHHRGSRASGSTTASAGSGSRADASAEPPFVEHYGTGGGFWNAMRIYPTAASRWSAMANTTSAWDVQLDSSTRLEEPVMDVTHDFDVERARRDTPGVAPRRAPQQRRRRAATHPGDRRRHRPPAARGGDRRLRGSSRAPPTRSRTPTGRSAG